MIAFWFIVNFIEIYNIVVAESWHTPILQNKIRIQLIPLNTFHIFYLNIIRNKLSVDTMFEKKCIFMLFLFPIDKERSTYSFQLTLNHYEKSRHIEN